MIFTLGLLGIAFLIDLFLIPGMGRKTAFPYHIGKYDYAVAWILKTFLGILGIHRIYMSKLWTGLLWRCTTGLFGIGCICDFWTQDGQVNERNKLGS